MGFELTTQSIGTKQINYDNFAEQSIDCNISLPDYCPDIVRILKCSVQNNIISTKLSGDRACADGNSKIRIIYVDDSNSIFCYEYEYPFSKYVELPGSFDSSVLTVCAKTEYINCRAVSKRRLDVHGVISLRFRILCVKNELLIDNASGGGIQLKRKGIDVNDVVAVTSKMLKLTEVEQLDDGYADIGKVLFVNAVPIVTETKIIKGKALLKGEWTIKAVYASDGENNQTCTVDYSIPFNEISEIENLTEECNLDFSVCVFQADAEAKADNDGNYRYLSLNIEAEFEITAYCQKALKIITDAYSTQTSVNEKYMPVTFTKIAKTVNDTFSFSRSIDISSQNPQKLYAVSAGVPDCKCTFEKGKMYVKGSLPLDIFYIDEDGSPVFCEREADFDYSVSLDGETNKYVCIPQISVSGYNCRLNSGTVEFNAEINIIANVNKQLECRVLTELEENENGKFADRKSSLVIYFCLGGESVWDIARKYNTTIEEIMEENSLTTDYLEEKTMLLIPVK